MIKKFIISLLILNTMLFTSCSIKEIFQDMNNNESESNLVENSRTDILNNDNKEEIADARFEQILYSIQTKDKDEMISLFSEISINEIEDFDSDFDYLINFIQDEIVSWERKHWSSRSATEYGKKTINIFSKYEVKTDKNIYLFYIIDFPEDTINPANEGLATLRVIKAEDEEKEFTYWEDMDVGIYNPEE